MLRESRWREVDHDALVAAMERVVSEPELVVKKATASLVRAADLAECDRRAQAEERLLALLARR